MTLLCLSVVDLSRAGVLRANDKWRHHEGLHRIRCPLILSLISLSLAACDASREKPRVAAPNITVTAVQSKAVTLRQEYVCQIHSRHRIDVRAPAEGYLAAISISEGQMVKRDDLLFQVRQSIGKEVLDAGTQGQSGLCQSTF